MWKPVELPYYRHSNSLPATLPDEEAILSSRTVLRSDDSYHRVVAVGPHFIVKHGRRVHELEGQALLFLEHHLGDRPEFPKLYAMYRLRQTNHVCIVMQRVPGTPLSDIWPTLQLHEKESICIKLKQVMGLLREIPHPSIFGNVIGGSISHYLFYSPSGDKEICGPFNTEATFNAALINRIEAIYTDTGQHNTRANFYRRNLDRVLRGHSPTFSHSDLQKKNIIVLRKSSGDFDVGIIDWEDAGWFPCYWEYFIAFINLLWDDDWPEWIEHILSPYLSEAAVMKMVYNEIVF